MQVTQESRQFDLLLTGGQVIDPASGVKGYFDVAFSGDRVTAIEPHIDPSLAKQLQPVDGATVVPGLIDDHIHVCDGIGESITPDLVGIARGATTVADGGSCGTGNFGVFKAIMAANKTRILAWLNISALGQTDTRIGECMFLPCLNVEEAVDMARGNPDTIVGFKARLSSYVAGNTAMPALKLLLEAGEAAGLPVMIHVGDTGEPLGQILNMLRPGDVVSHYLTSRKNGILGIQWQPGARIIPEAFAARQRGVLLDIARGRNHLAFPIMQAAVEQDLLPDTLSTDLTRFSFTDPYFSLPMLMTQFMSFGVSFEDLLPCVTVNPARLLRRPELGKLQVGGIGDATLLEIENGAFTLTDVDGRTRRADKRVVAVGIVRAGSYTAITPPPAGD